MSIQRKIASAVLTCLAVSACSETELFTVTGFTAANSRGQISKSLGSDAVNYSQVVNGNGFAMKIGQEGFKMAAYSGVVEGTTGGDIVTTGEATFRGTWVLGGFQKIDILSSSPSIETLADGGIIEVTADFDKGTLVGSSNGASGTLVVNGEIAGAALGGAVTYRDAEGPLTGVIGDERAVGAFHGKGSDFIYAGGFLAE